MLSPAAPIDRPAVMTTTDRLARRMRVLLRAARPLEAVAGLWLSMNGDRNDRPSGGRGAPFPAPEPDARTADDGEFLPPVTVRTSDAERLYEIAMDMLLISPRRAGGLLDELRRAVIVEDDRCDPQVAGIGSHVEFIDHRDPSARPRRVQLVLPKDADGGGQVSVTADLGAALLGLTPGQSIVWPDRRGGAARLTVVAVSPDAS